jgi:AraC-like DNA-binding protein
MHENEAPWTVESLAAACGMPRSAFAQKFKDLVGEAPLEYLTNWRMQKAILRDEDKKGFGVATSVGYDSDAACRKAFKRVFGVARKRFAGNVPSVTQGSATSPGLPPPVAATSRYRDLYLRADLRGGRSLQCAPVPTRKCSPREGWWRAGARSIS